MPTATTGGGADGVRLNVAEGEFVSIIRPSGCGKSTLFNVIGGLIDDHNGEVLIEGRPVDGAHKDVGVVFQEGVDISLADDARQRCVPLEIEGVEKEATGTRLPASLSSWWGWMASKSFSRPVLRRNEATHSGGTDTRL